jgi:tRNA-2-methylthio-N6-dimethylallyladenosine synthase
MARYSLLTFGCQMNVHDSERMHEVLQRAGHVEVDDPERADVVVINTCSVREKAEQKLRSEVGRLAKRKRSEPELVVVVAGCVAQQEGESLVKSEKAIDIVIGPDNIPELPRLLDDVALGAPPAVRTVFDLDAPRFLTALSVAGASPTAYVTIMKGCDERCSFCIVPTTRGPERYRPSGEVIAEIAALVASGVREVTLLGQTVNSYRDPSRGLPPAPGADAADPDESEFAALLRAITAAVPGLARLRYTSPHPRHLVPSLVRAHAELPVLARHLHLPVQSGSDRQLKRMIRRYTRAEYVERVRGLEAAVPGLTLSTDIIVGFPGETEEDFEETLSLVRELDFKGLFAFKYSPRPGTPSLKLGDDVTEDEKSARLARLFEVSEAILGRHLESLVGTTQRVLVEGPGKDPKTWTGRSEHNAIVHVDGAADLDLAGVMADVVVTRAYKHSVAGELTEASRAAAPPRAPAPKPARRSLTVLAAEEPDACPS